MKDSLIAWTDHTFNPWMGCAKVSAGCKNCYAERLTKNRMGLSLWGEGRTRQVTKSPWRNVLKWERDAAHAAEQALVFCGSLCDVFEDHAVANETRPRVWDLIRSCQSLVFQLLTKRPENITRFLPADWGLEGWPNVWLGTSLEDITVASRADHLREIPAAVRFVSYEPALGPLDELDLSGVDWVIYGGESGPGFRPENKDWARSMRARCKAEGVAFFHKQSAGGRTETGVLLDGEIVREYPTSRSTRPMDAPTPSCAPTRAIEAASTVAASAETKP